MSKKIELPFGWESVTLGEVTSKSSEKATPSPESSERFLGMDCIERNGLRPFKNYSFSDFKSSGNRFVINQVLYGRMRPYLNKVFKATFNGVCSGEFIVLNCTAIAPELLQYLLHHRNFVKFANSKTSGDRPRITFEEISTYPIYLPPLAEQQRIVSKIEELFSSLDKGVESLRAAQQQLKVYRQAVLKWAFEGKLTNEKLDLRWSTELTQTKLEDISEKITDGEHITPTRISNGIMLLSARNVQNEHLNLSNVDFIPDYEYERIIKRCHPEEDDILISCSGSIGRVCRVPANLQFTLVRSVALIKMNWRKFSSKYIMYALLSPGLQLQIEKGKRATAQANLFLGPIKNLTIPLCDFNTQLELVSEIESRLSICDKIEESIEQSLQQAEALRQSILKKAFEGKLVPQDPNDEPASVLLERIRMENEKTPVPGKLKKGRKSRQTELVFETA